MADINPDDQNLKNQAVHMSGKAGGVLVGKRHTEGGIQAINLSTGQPLEMEGGEVVITRDAVSDQTKRPFNGQMLTNRQILSKINESGGGISFAEDGAELPEELVTGESAMFNYGGITMNASGVLSKMYAKGGATKPFDFSQEDWDAVNDVYNAYRRYTDEMDSEETAMIVAYECQEQGIPCKIYVTEIQELDADGEVVDSFFPHYIVIGQVADNDVIFDYKSHLFMSEDLPQGIFYLPEHPNVSYIMEEKKIPFSMLKGFNISERNRMEENIS